MSDDALREVLRSPLDDLPRAGRRGGRAVAAFLLAAATGAGAVAGGRALSSPEPGPQSSTTTTLAAGGEPAAAVPVPMGEVGVEVAATWSQGEHRYLLVATTVRPGVEPTTVEAVPSAHWTLRLEEGDLLPAVAEYTSAAVPGLFVVEFPGPGSSGAADLLAYPAAEVLEGAFVTSRESAQLPWEEPPDGTPYRLGGEEVVIERVRVDDAGGEVAWHLAGATPGRAVVSAGASYQEVGGGPQVIVPEADLPFASLVAGASPVPSARSGLLHLFRLDDPQQPSFRSRFWGDPERVVPIQGFTLEIGVRLYRYAQDPVVVPFELPAAD